MHTEVSLTTDSRHGGRAIHLPREGGDFFWHYGPEAFIDVFMSNRTTVNRAWPTVTRWKMQE
jgi:hypothetical protein